MERREFISSVCSVAVTGATCQFAIYGGCPYRHQAASGVQEQQGTQGAQQPVLPPVGPYGPQGPIWFCPLV